MFHKNQTIADFDRDIWQAILHEEQRQEDHIDACDAGPGLSAHQ